MNADYPINDHAANLSPRFRYSILSLLVATTLASLCLAWLILFPKSDVVAILQVTPSTGSYSILQQTQLLLLRSPVTINTDLSDPKISELPLVTEQTDPVDWLMRELRVSFAQNSELLVIELRVPSRYSGQGQAVLARLIEEYLSLVNKADPTRKIKLIQPPTTTNHMWTWN